MTLLPAVVTAGQAGALTAAALGAAAVLVLRGPRARAVSMLVALLLAVAAIVALKAHTVSSGISGHRALALAGAVVGLAGLAVVTEIMRRRPQAFALLAF